MTAMKTTSEILNLLKDYKMVAFNKYGITSLCVFGSVARGEQTSKSDVDICYDGAVPSLLTLEMIQSDLEQLLGSPVELIRFRKNMNPLLLQRINKEGIYV